MSWCILGDGQQVEASQVETWGDGEKLNVILWQSIGYTRIQLSDTLASVKSSSNSSIVEISNLSFIVIAFRTL